MLVRDVGKKSTGEGDAPYPIALHGVHAGACSAAKHPPEAERQNLLHEAVRHDDSPCAMKEETAVRTNAKLN
jgi:hypothetical protein